MSQPIQANHAGMHSLADDMDELRNQAVSLMSRYEECFNHALASKTFAGGAGTASVVSGTEIHRAQTNIQAKFEHVNQLLRQAAATYTGQDEQSKQALLGLQNHNIKYT